MQRQAKDSDTQNGTRAKCPNEYSERLLSAKSRLQRWPVGVVLVHPSSFRQGHPIYFEWWLFCKPASSTIQPFHAWFISTNFGNDFQSTVMKRNNDNFQSISLLVIETWLRRLNVVECIQLCYVIDNFKVSLPCNCVLYIQIHDV